LLGQIGQVRLIFESNRHVCLIFVSSLWDGLSGCLTRYKTSMKADSANDPKEINLVGDIDQFIVLHLIVTLGDPIIQTTRVQL